MDDPVKYHLHFLDAARRQFVLWGKQARMQNLYSEYHSVLHEVLTALQNKPTEVGDILFHYKRLPATEYRVMKPNWIILWYGVIEEAKQVVTGGAKQAPGSPLF